MLLVPVMTFSWLVTAGFVYAVIGTTWATALIISACLAPTDPVLAAAVLQGGSRFSARVPRRLRHMLSAESGCNDGYVFSIPLVQFKDGFRERAVLLRAQYMDAGFLPLLDTY